MKKQYVNIFVCALILFVVLAGCDIKEERPSYDVIENDLPTSDVVITWKDNQGFDNIAAIENNLSESHKEKFSASLDWIATESGIDLEKLAGKNAKQVVAIANCLKTSKPQEHQSCLSSQQ